MNQAVFRCSYIYRIMASGRLWNAEIYNVSEEKYAVRQSM